ncbi:hypothetical protein CRE_02462 [Caenorhabditis remanei]|uniref:Serpentine Receptor, class BC (Class B-like) n=1 Tax=Caenorhabditis remanei TaxID=31234 RepID=E3MWM9_CAERE|nr:hypothetical protein CRE_02462 [Caenorhabditis remanei]
MGIMNISAVVISAIGVVSSVFTYGMNIHLLRNYKKKKEDIMIFYCRFVVDVLIGFVITFYLSFVIFYSLFTEQLSEYHNFIIYITIPTSTLGATRSIVTLSIYMERFMAVYAPIFFHKHKHIFSLYLIFAIAALFGLTNPIVLFGFCSYDFDFPKTCAVFGCAINTCFRNYWSTHKLVRFQKPKNAIYFLFQIIFSLIFSFSLLNFGPFGAVLQNFGLAIESFLFYRMLLRKSSSFQPSDSTVHAARVKACTF